MTTTREKDARHVVCREHVFMDGYGGWASRNPLQPLPPAAPQTPGCRFPPPSSLLLLNIFVRRDTTTCIGNLTYARRGCLALLSTAGLPPLSYANHDLTQQARTNYALASGLRLSPPSRLAPATDTCDERSRVLQEQVIGVHRRILCFRSL